MAKPRCLILRIDSYEGDDTYIRCGDGEQDYLFAVVQLSAAGEAEIVDSGYRSFAEAARAWPEARPARTRNAK